MNSIRYKRTGDLQMKRREFLRTSAGFGAAAVFAPGIPTSWSAPIADSEKPMQFEIGEKIASEAFILDEVMSRKTILTLCEEKFDTLVNMLYIFGGGALDREDKPGIWCPDSFDDLHILRFVHEKYEFAGVNIIPVACAPVYSSQYYGLEEGVFLNEPDDSEKFQEAAKKFIDSTQEAADRGVIPVQPYFDLRLRLVLNREEDLLPGPGYGEIYAWQSKFRADDEPQKYGVPTIWLMDPHGVVLEKPFHSNIYHTDPFQINYTIVDVDKALSKYI